MKTILFTGGGSAGHVVPNLAIMNELRYSHRVIYMGTNGIERGLVEKAGYAFFQIECPKLVRSLSLKNLTIPFRLKKAVKAAREILEKEKFCGAKSPVQKRSSPSPRKSPSCLS